VKRAHSNAWMCRSLNTTWLVIRFYLHTVTFKAMNCHEWWPTSVTEVINSQQTCHNCWHVKQLSLISASVQSVRPNSNRYSSSKFSYRTRCKQYHRAHWILQKSLSSLLGNPNVHYQVHKNPPLDHIRRKVIQSASPTIFILNQFQYPPRHA
jgi:hypothetical protein